MRLALFLLVSTASLYSAPKVTHEEPFAHHILADQVYSMPKSPSTFLLSFRSSGSHWLMYCIQYLTMKTWQAPHKRYDFFKGVDRNKPAYFRGHECDRSYIFNESDGYYFRYRRDTDRLILLVRNYKESLFKRGIPKALLEDPKNYPLEQPARFDLYYKPIKLYDAWNSDQRLMIYYEDLILHPRATLHQIAQFLNLETARVDHFMKTYDTHVKSCFALARRLNGNPSTSHGQIHYHSKSWTLDENRLIDGAMKEYSPGTFERYLTRYATPLPQ